MAELEKRSTNITDLPAEILAHISTYLDIRSAAKLTTTCSILRDAGESRIWEEIHVSRKSMQGMYIDLDLNDRFATIAMALRTNPNRQKAVKRCELEINGDVTIALQLLRTLPDRLDSLRLFPTETTEASDMVNLLRKIGGTPNLPRLKIVPIPSFPHLKELRWDLKNLDEIAIVKICAPSLHRLTLDLTHLVLESRPEPTGVRHKPLANLDILRLEIPEIEDVPTAAQVTHDLLTGSLNRQLAIIDLVIEGRVRSDFTYSREFDYLAGKAKTSRLLIYPPANYGYHPRSRVSPVGMFSTVTFIPSFLDNIYQASDLATELQGHYPSGSNLPHIERLARISDGVYAAVTYRQAGMYQTEALGSTRAIDERILPNLHKMPRLIQYQYLRPYSDRMRSYISMKHFGLPFDDPDANVYCTDPVNWEDDGSVGFIVRSYSGPTTINPAYNRRIHHSDIVLIHLRSLSPISVRPDLEPLADPRQRFWEDQTDFCGQRVPAQIMKRIYQYDGIELAWQEGKRGITLSEGAWQILLDWYIA